MVGENIEKLYSAYIIPFSADESYSLILIYKPKDENFFKALFITKDLTTNEERKNLLKLDKAEFNEEQALKVFQFTAKDLFEREIKRIDPGAKLIELKFENPERVEENLKKLKKLLKELEQY